MHCLKCGREIPDGTVFCKDCLEIMAEHPIPPDTHIQLPRRPVRTTEKKKTTSSAEQIAKLKNTIHWLWVVIALLVVAAGTLALLLAYQLDTNLPQLPSVINCIPPIR